MSKTDFSDRRFGSRKIHWASLIRDGYEPEKVLLEAQKQGLWRIAKSAATRIENQKREKQKGKQK